MVEIRFEEDTGIINIDDGKANVMGFDFIESMNSCLDQAQEKANAIVIEGRSGMFCAGFDLKVVEKGMDHALPMFKGGFTLVHRLYKFPMPVISIANGHCIGMGAFILLASDTRIGGTADYQISLPETKISMVFNDLLLAFVNERISPSHKTRVALQSVPQSPEESVSAGLLDQLVDTDKLLQTGLFYAQELAKLPRQTYADNKLALRADSLKTMSEWIDAS